MVILDDVRKAVCVRARAHARVYACACVCPGAYSQHDDEHACVCARARSRAIMQMFQGRHAITQKHTAQQIDPVHSRPLRNTEKYLEAHSPTDRHSALRNSQENTVTEKHTAQQIVPVYSGTFRNTQSL